MEVYGARRRWMGQEGSGERLWSVSAAVPESAYQYVIVHQCV